MSLKIFYSDNGTLTDYSVELNEYFSGTQSFDFVAAEDYFFIGSNLPFNSLYFKFDGSNVNSNSAIISEIAYWSDDTFEPAVEIIDETKSSGKTFAQSGFILWVPDKDEGWTQESTNYRGEEVTGLTSVVVYDLYWLRIKMSADLSSGVALSWIGHKFSDDDDLAAEYPDLDRSAVKTAFESGKTDWEAQHVRAAEVIIKDLKAKNVIVHKSQILDREDLKLASVSKVAEIIYAALGDDYNDNKAAARIEYNSRLSRSFVKADTNKNARIDDSELRITPGRLIR